MQRARTILWDIYEEHLDEAAFLWGQWEDALVGANYTLDEVIEGPEERLRAHLDALVLGGKPVSEKLLVPSLAEDDIGKVAAAAWTLLHAADADHFDTVIGAFANGEPSAKSAIARALELSDRPHLPAHMLALWPKSDETLRGVIFDIVASRDRTWAREAIPKYIGTEETPLRAAALRAARYRPDPALGSYVEHALRDRDAGVRAEALCTAFVMGLPSAIDACQLDAGIDDDHCRLPLALLASSPSGRNFVVSRLANATARRHAVWALGFTADVDTAELLLTLLDDEKDARLAGEALSAMTGIAISGPLAQPAVTKGPGIEEVSPDDPPPAILPEDHLPMPNANAVRHWWQGVRQRFQPGSRYVGGLVRDPRNLEAALATTAMWRRAVMSLESAARQRAPVSIDPRRWARMQSTSLA